MPMNVVCPNCARSFVFPDASAGRQTTCQACGRQYVVPAAGTAPAPVPAPQAAPQGSSGGAAAWGSAAAAHAPAAGATQPIGSQPAPFAPFGAAPQPGPMGGPLPGAALPGMGMPMGATPGTGMPMGGNPGAGLPGMGMQGGTGPGSFGSTSSMGMGLPSSISMGMGGGPGLGGGTAPMDSLGLPALNAPGLPALPTSAPSKPRFPADAPSPEWYANPWTWTAVGLGGFVVLGIIATTLVNSNRGNRNAKPVAATPAAPKHSGPVPKTAFFPGGNPIARPAGSSEAAAPSTEPTVPNDEALSGVLGPTPPAPRPFTAPTAAAATAAPTPSSTAPAATKSSDPFTPVGPLPGASTPPAAAPRRTGPAAGDLGAFASGGGAASAEAAWNLTPDPFPGWEPAKPATTSRVLIPNAAGATVEYIPGWPATVGIYKQKFSELYAETYLVPSGRKIGSFKTELPFAKHPALKFSPGGELVAWQDDETGILHVFDMKTSNQVATLAAPGGAKADRFARRGNRFEFFAPRNLAVYVGDKIHVWEDLQEPAKEIPHAGLEGAERTPGGKYFIHAANGAVRIADFATGEEKAHYALPAGSWGKAALSDDGKELALLSNADPAKLLVIDFASGRKVLEHQLDFLVSKGGRFARSDDLPPLRWLPERSGWLVSGSQVVERESGKLVWVIPVPEDRSAFSGKFDPVVLPTYQILFNGRGGLETAALPLEKIAAAVQVVRQGGEAIDTVMPPITAASFDGAAEIPSGAVRGWNAGPDPAGSVLAVEWTSFPTKSPINMFRSMYHAPAGKGMVLANFTDHPRWSFDDPTKRPPSKSWYECFEISTGRATSRGVFPNGAYAQAVSPSGALVATLSGEFFDRLDLWQVAGGKHVGGSRPYAAEPSRIQSDRDKARQDAFSAGAPPGFGADVGVVRSGEAPTSGRTMTWVGFASEDVLWTMSAGRKLVCWKIPEFKAIAYEEVPFITELRFSPNHAYLGYLTPNALRWLKAADGTVAGEMPLPASAGDIGSFRLSPGGDRAAVLRQGAIHLGDMKDGHFDEPLLLPIPVSNQFAWIGGRYLLLGEGLYEIQRRAVVWRYVPGGGVRAAGGSDFPDGRLWFAAPTQGGSPLATLAAAALPDPAARKAIEAELASEPVVVLGPGSKVRLQVELGEIADADGVRASIERQLAANEVGVDPDSPLVFRLSYKIKDTQNVTYVESGGSPFAKPDPSKTTSVTFTTGEASMTLEDLEGKIRWKSSTIFRNSPPMSIRSNEIDTVGNRQLGAAKSFLSHLRLPQVLYLQPMHGDAVPGLDTSSLNAYGAAPLPPKAP